MIAQARKKGAAAAVDDIFAGLRLQSGTDVDDRAAADADVDDAPLDVDAFEQHRQRVPSRLSLCSPGVGPLPLAGTNVGRAASTPAGTGSVGPANAAATPASAMSRTLRTPPASAARQASAATKPVRGSATASAQKHGPAASSTTRPPPTAASSPNATRASARP